MEALENHPLLAPPPAKKRGRPPGSKNKKTLEAIQMKAEGTGLEPVIQPVDPVPEEAVTVAAAASGILEATPSMAPCALLYHKICIVSCPVANTALKYAPVDSGWKPYCSTALCQGKQHQLWMHGSVGPVQAVRIVRMCECAVLCQHPDLHTIMLS